MNMQKMYVEEMKSMGQISALSGIPVSTVRRRLISLGVKIRTKKQAISLFDKWGAARSEKKSFNKMTNLQKTALKNGWKRSLGDRVNKTRINPRGYEEYSSRSNENYGRPVHVVMMEKRLGRNLMCDEVVHHIDSNKRNNQENNLALMTRGAHSRLHRREEKLLKGRK